MTPQKLLILINPISGGSDKENDQTIIENFCEENHLACSFYETKGENDEEKLKQAIEKHRPDALVAAGGDGTVHLAARVLEAGPKLPLGILPLGSGNGLSKDLGIPQNLADALRVLLRPKHQAIDTLRVNGQLCIHVMDLGFNALVVKCFDEAGTRGQGTYAKIALQQYLSFKPKHFRIQTDTENFEGQAFMVTVTNANNFGSNATVNPHGILNDGIFEVCIIEPFPKSAALGILYQLYNETIHLSTYTRLIRCTRATLFNPEEELMQIDGEIMPSSKEIEVVMQAQALTVLLQETPDNVVG